MDQLEVYAYLVEKKLNEPVGKLILYFTGDEDPVYEIPADIEDVEERMENSISLQGASWTKTSIIKQKQKEKTSPPPAASANGNPTAGKNKYHKKCRAVTQEA